MLIVIKLLNIAVSDFDAKKSAQCSQVLAVIELVVAGPRVFHQRIPKVIEVEAKRRVIKVDRNWIENASL